MTFAVSDKALEAYLNDENEYQTVNSSALKINFQALERGEGPGDIKLPLPFQKYTSGKKPTRSQVSGAQYMKKLPMFKEPRSNSLNISRNRSNLRNSSSNILPKIGSGTLSNNDSE